MFRCQLCATVVPAGTTCHRVVVSTRSKLYPHRAKAHKVVRFTFSGKRTVIRVDDPGGTGREIARELQVCSECNSRTGRD